MLVLPFLFQAIIHLPIGYVRYCAEYRDPGCVVEQVTPQDLAYLNKAIVEWMEPVDNPDPGQRWEAFKRDGDCENHVASVRLALVAFGVNPKDMRFEAGTITEADGRTAQHVVLVVALRGKEWVVDMKTPDMLYRTTDRPYPWTPLTSESDGVIWKAEEGT